MALNFTDGVVLCAPGVVTTVVAANVDRKFGIVQNQHPNFPVRVRLDSDPTALLGIELSFHEIYRFGIEAMGPGAISMHFEGDVRVFNVGSADCPIYFIEMSE